MRKKNGKFYKVVIVEALVLSIIIIGFVVTSLKGGDDSEGNLNESTATAEPTLSPTPQLTAEELQAIKEEEERKEREKLAKEYLQKADLLAAMYDYDAAIELIESIKGYKKLESLVTAIKKYETAKEACIVWEDNTKISHIFFHSLIVDTDKAFGPGSSQVVGYNKYMTTVDEFNKMLEQMYERGYVLVSIHDIAKMTKQKDGTEKMEPVEILLPEGKIPFVLSQDDVNYYQYMEGDGFASRIVIGEDGIPTCEYIKDDGTVVTGEYDVLPIVNRFLKEHPDFSYRGAKGILAVTGYEGVFGYDTGWHMHDLETEEGKNNLKKLQEEAMKVAEAIKADGWEFASHSYTHTNMTNNSVEKVQYDTDKWAKEVEPLIGKTDIYIYPFGADICDWRDYSGPKYDYLKAAGFLYYCNVDSAQYWIQIHDEFMRMGRINFDGDRMYGTPEKLSYFFDVDSVFDKARPVPVP